MPNSTKRRFFGGCILAAMASIPAFFGLGYASATPSSETKNADEPKLQIRFLQTQRVFKKGSISVEERRYRRQKSRGRLFSATLAPAAKIEVASAKAPAPLSSFPLPAQGVAINGGFYDGNNEPMGVVVRKGKVVAKLRRRGGSGVFVVQTHPHRVSVVHRDAFVGLANVEFAVQSIDRLVVGGKSLVGDTANKALDARSAICVTSSGEVKMAVLFDDQAIEEERNGLIRLNRKSSSTGVSLQEWSQILQEILGCSEALNLDGGYSTSFFAQFRDEHHKKRTLEVAAYRATINVVTATP